MDPIIFGHGTGRVRLLLVALIGMLTAIALIGAPEGVAKKKRWGHEHGKHGKRWGKAKANVTVMTRNVYLGADLVPLLTTTSFPEAIDAAGEIYEEVERTNFPERAVPLAREIKRSKADLVGLQEVAHYRVQEPSDGGAPPLSPVPGATPATETEYDFLELLLDHLDGKYRVVAVQEEMDAELPADIDGDDATGNPGLAGADLDVRLTMRDVILQRRHGKVRALRRSVEQEHYDAALPASVGGESVPVVRGWQSVNAVYKKGGGHRWWRYGVLRFVNTHLEAYSAAIKEAQAIELTQEGGPLRTWRPVVLVGDLNSGLLDPHQIGDAGASGTDADQLAFKALQQFGMKDYGAVQSCCYGPALDINEPPFDHTVDHVLANRRARAKLLKSYVTGDDPAEITPSGLWPSDHGGVVSKLLLGKR